MMVFRDLLVALSNVDSNQKIRAYIESEKVADHTARELLTYPADIDSSIIEMYVEDMEVRSDGGIEVSLVKEDYESNIEELRLTFHHRDKYDMPMYCDQYGKWWVDLDCREGHQGRLWDLWMNDPESYTPNYEMDKKIKCYFMPKRITDPADTELKMIYC